MREIVGAIDRVIRRRAGRIEIDTGIVQVRRPVNRAARVDQGPTCGIEKERVMTRHLRRRRVRWIDPRDRAENVENFVARQSLEVGDDVEVIDDAIAILVGVERKVEAVFDRTIRGAAVHIRTRPDFNVGVAIAKAARLKDLRCRSRARRVGRRHR